MERRAAEYVERSAMMWEPWFSSRPSAHFKWNSMCGDSVACNFRVCAFIRKRERDRERERKHMSEI